MIDELDLALVDALRLDPAPRGPASPGRWAWTRPPSPAAGPGCGPPGTPGSPATPRPTAWAPG
ncbi:hypothetical protein ACFQZC_26785 [Streptacidiphilus monticola]